MHSKYCKLSRETNWAFIVQCYTLQWSFAGLFSGRKDISDIDHFGKIESRCTVNNETVFNDYHWLKSEPRYLCRTFAKKNIFINTSG